LPSGTNIDFSIFLVPKGADISNCTTINDLRNAGCFRVDQFGLGIKK
jgi:hypothetical protein